MSKARFRVYHQSSHRREEKRFAKYGAQVPQPRRTKMTKFVILDANYVTTFDSPEEAIASVTQDGTQRLHESAIVAKIEPVQYITPSVTKQECGEEIFAEVRKQQEARKLRYAKEANLASGSLIGRGGAVRTLGGY